MRFSSELSQYRHWTYYLYLKSGQVLSKMASHWYSSIQLTPALIKLSIVDGHEDDLQASRNGILKPSLVEYSTEELNARARALSLSRLLFYCLLLIQNSAQCIMRWSFK